MRWEVERMTLTPRLIDIFRSLSWVIVSVYLHVCLNLSPFSFVSWIQRGTQYNAKEEDGYYGSEVLMNNNPCTALADAGSWLLLYIRRVSDNACHAPNEYPKEPSHLLEFGCDSPIGSATLRGTPKDLSGAPMCSQTYHNYSHHTPVSVIRDSSYSCTCHQRFQLLWRPAGMPS